MEIYIYKNFKKPTMAIAIAGTLLDPWLTSSTKLWTLISSITPHAAVTVIYSSPPCTPAPPRPPPPCAGMFPNHVQSWDFWVSRVSNEFPKPYLATLGLYKVGYIIQESKHHPTTPRSLSGIIMPILVRSTTGIKSSISIHFHVNVCS